MATTIRCTYLYMYIFNICISGLAAAILDFPMHSTLTTKTSAPSSRQSPETELYMTGKLQLVDSVPSWIFSRKQLPVTLHIIQLSRASAKTRKHGYNRWSFVASSFALWDKCTSGLAAGICREFQHHLHHKIFNNYRLLQIASKV